jgi:hypothetical protein
VVRVEVAITVVVGTLMVLATIVGLVRFQRSLDRPGGRDGMGGIADAFGNLIDVYDPAQARAAREIKRYEDAGPVTRSPDDEDEDPVQLIRGPDGSPRAVRIRRPRG